MSGGASGAALRPSGSLDLDRTAVLFFDGVCNLCNRSVDFLIKRDRGRTLRYAALQGTTAARELPSELREGDLQSVVLLDADGVHLRSTAVLRAVGRLGGLWSLARLLLLVPRPLRDAVYNAVAKRRYRLWGKRDTCRLPTPEERATFLD